MADHLDPRRRPAGLSHLNRGIVAVSLVSVGFAIAETEPTLTASHAALFRAAELVFASVFILEFLARFWIAAEAGGWRGRWRWVRSWEAVVDMVSIAPVLIAPGLAPFYLLRLLRLLRLFRLAKLGHLSSAWSLVGAAIHERRHELLLALAAALVVMLGAATAMYLVEGATQPEAFGSIPRAMWWATVTLTTIGYGDVYPQTVPGKLVAGVTAILGVGLIAAPTGIMAAAFSDALARRRRLRGET